jgi:hypothetical protein
LPLIERKRWLARLLAKPSARFIVEHLTRDGPAIFDHVCRWGWSVEANERSRERPRLQGHRAEALRAVAGASIAPPPNLRETNEIVPGEPQFNHSTQAQPILRETGVSSGGG